MKRIAIVGSRDFPDLDLVRQTVRKLPKGCVIVSGGARGVDSVAVEEAERLGLQTAVHLPDLKGVVGRSAATAAYYARNQRIVDDSEMVVAFSEKDRGGTFDTVKRALAAGIPCRVYGRRGSSERGRT